MIPVAFDDMLGRLHPARGEHKSGLGVVLVPPHGLEALAAAKSLRLLADSIAASGHACLRFDLPGTGDALGGDADPDRIAAWTGAITAAATMLAATAGVSGIVLVGLRFGALLAGKAAPSVAALAGLVLIDPIVRGRAYGRELTMTAKAVAEGARLDADAAVTDTGLEIGGFLTTASTLDAMRGLDLAKLPAPEAPVFVMRRPGAQDAASLAASWPEATITIEEAPGLDGIALSPTSAVTPLAAFAGVVGWIDRLPSRPNRAPGPLPPAILASETFVEEPVTFGPDRRLFGIFCHPVSRIGDTPTLLILNAGRNSHIGWARSGVTLARRLAAHGIGSLRIDLGGIGDSADRPGASDTLAAVLYNPALGADVTAAVDLIESQGSGPIAIMGSCSGAHLALHSAAAERRINGVVLVNIQRFVWRKGETVEQAIASSYALASAYVAKVWDRQAWTRVISGKRRVAPIVWELAKRLFARARRFVPSAETRLARSVVTALSRRNVPVEIVFSQRDAGLEELARHFGPQGRWLKRLKGVRLLFIANSDHDLTPRNARETLFVQILDATRTWRRQDMLVSN